MAKKNKEVKQAGKYFIRDNKGKDIHGSPLTTLASAIKWWRTYTNEGHKNISVYDKDGNFVL